MTDIYLKSEHHEISFKKLETRHARNFQSDEVYGRSTYKNKDHSITLYIGKTIADLIDFKCNDLIDVYEVIGKSYCFLLKKDANGTRKLWSHKYNKPHFLYTAFILPRCMKIYTQKTIVLKSDFYDNNSLIVDIKELIQE